MLRSSKQSRALLRAGGLAVVLSAMAAPSAFASTARSSDHALKGSPIHTFSVYENSSAFPEGQTMTAGEAAEAYVNAHGGINGHPLVISFCNTNLVPNDELACMTNGSNTKSNVAEVGGTWDLEDQADDAALTKGGVAALSPSLYEPLDFQSTCPNCFATMQGPIASAGEVELLIDQLHVKNIAVLSVDLASEHTIDNQVQSIIKKRDPGVKLSFIFIPYTASDMTTYAAQVTASGAQGVAISLGALSADGIVEDLRSQGSQIPAVGDADIFNPNTVSALGSSNTHLYDLTQYASETPQDKIFEAAYKKEDPSGPTQSDLAKSEWIGIMMFANIARSLKHVTRASVLAAAKHLTSYQTGFTPSLDFAQKFTGDGGALPRLFNPSHYYVKIVGDKFENLRNGKAVSYFVAP